ncbi:ChbG/HpnK family deacetylase [Comamonas humi]
MKPIVLCADDYALHPAIDAAVQALAGAGRLSATSCMTTAPRWREAVQALPALRPRLAVGLHFNLTEGFGQQAAAGIGQRIAQAYTGRLDRDWLRTQWRMQLDAFENALGTPPDFIDGHQHVHQLPAARAAMLDELQRRYGDAPPLWVRSTAPAGRLAWQPKAAVIAALGGWALSRRLRRQGLARNRGFGGVYGFDAPTPEDYGRHMDAWLQACGSGSLLMCHPADTVVQGDAIGAQRPVEYGYLRSEAFGALLRARNCAIVQGPAEILQLLR